MLAKVLVRETSLHCAVVFVVALLLLLFPVSSTHFLFLTPISCRSFLFPVNFSLFWSLFTLELCVYICHFITYLCIFLSVTSLLVTRIHAVSMDDVHAYIHCNFSDPILNGTQKQCQVGRLSD